MSKSNSSNNIYINVVHFKGKPAVPARTLVSGTSMTTNALPIMAIQVLLFTRRLTGNGAQNHQLLSVKFCVVIMIAIPELLHKRTFSEKMENVAQSTILHNHEVLRGVSEW
jgi:hypothetical protein